MDLYKLIGTILIIDLGILLALVTMNTNTDWSDFADTDNYKTLQDAAETSYLSETDDNQSLAVQAESVEEVGTGGASVGNTYKNIRLFTGILFNSNRDSRSVAGSDAVFAGSIIRPISWAVALIFAFLHMTLLMKLWVFVFGKSDA